MPAIIGGTRDRLIHDSIFNLVKNGLTSLGWFDGGINAPQDYPVTLVASQVDWSQEIDPNTVSISAGNISSVPWEVGTDLQQFNRTHYVDVFGANEAIGLQLSGDIQDLLKGKFEGLEGWITPETINVFDWRQTPPPRIFWMEVNSVNRDRPTTTHEHWMNFYWCVSLQTSDYYNTNRDEGLYDYSNL